MNKLFVDRLLEGSSRPVPESIVQIGQQLGLTVIAARIEEEHPLDALREMRCTLGQGYLFAKPEAPKLITARIESAADEPIFIQTIKTDDLIAVVDQICEQAAQRNGGKGVLDVLAAVFECKGVKA